MTNMAEDLKASAFKDDVPLRGGASTAEDRRSSQRKRSPRERKARTTDTVIYAVLAVLVLALMVPFIWMVSSSLKENNQVLTVPIQWIPAEFVWSNYTDIWTRIPMMGYLQNSLYLAVIITCLQVLTGSLAAYGFSKVRFPGRDVLFLAYIGTIAVPWQAYMVPQYIMMQNLGLTNSFNALILLQAFGAFGVFLMRQYYMTIPDELCEAARIDGLSEYGIWARVILPLVKAGPGQPGAADVRQHLERLHGPVHLPHVQPPVDRPAGPALLRGPVRRRIRHDHDRLGDLRDPHPHHLPGGPALLHPGHRHERHEGMSSVARAPNAVTSGAAWRDASPARDSRPSGASSASSTPSWQGTS
jgi:multiple sugar transport system permease protein